MLRMAILFAVIALIAAGLGFYGLSDVSANIAKFFALIFAVLFVVALLVGCASSAEPPPDVLHLRGLTAAGRDTRRIRLVYFTIPRIGLARSRGLFCFVSPPPPVVNESGSDVPTSSR